MNREFFVTAPYGLAELLTDELHQLGITDARSGRGGARFSGTLEQAYRVCLWSRTGNRVLQVLHRGPAANPDQLYDRARNVAWKDHFGPDSTLAVTFRSTRSEVSHEQFGAQRTKDAIVDQLRETTGRRPSVQKKQPDVRIYVEVVDDEALVALDLSGDPLGKRGYRTVRTRAPLKENVAAAILLRSGWPEVAEAGGALVDPMCGAGTFLIEGAWMAGDTAPGLLRAYWGFSGWRQHSEALWNELLEEARDRRERGRERIPPIRGWDVDRGAVRATLEHLKRAGLDKVAHVERGTIERLDVPDLPTGIVVTNPPYGVRLEANDGRRLAELHATLGNTLKTRFPGWQAFVLVGEKRLGKQLGLRATRTHTFYNGSIKCTLLHLPIHAAPRPAPQDLVNRLRKNRKRLSKWIKKHDITCYRLYDADLPEYAAAVDCYDGHAVVQEYEPPATIEPARATRHVRELVRAVQETLDVSAENVVLKVRRRQRGQSQYEKRGSTRATLEVTEGGLRFLVNLTDYLDTGLFLDHRITRQRIRESARDARFLNLFAYTGTATVYAAAGGARHTTTVDLSNTYLDWARKNMELNGFGGRDHSFVRADVLKWLGTDRGTYDLIFLDPPTFSTSKKMDRTLDIQRDHVELIRSCMSRLEAAGVLWFSTNARKFELDRSALEDLSVEDVTRETIPRDFERRSNIHTCFVIRHGSSP